MLPKLGVQTIIWGEEFEDGIDKALAAIKQHGFQGVEFAQSPKKLGNPETFENLLNRHGLVLLGLAGGSLTRECPVDS
jgi:sugar phosphate isomerase/epimerase